MPACIDSTHTLRLQELEGLLAEEQVIAWYGVCISIFTFLDRLLQLGDKFKS